jgi:hypothetical protein
MIRLDRLQPGKAVAQSGATIERTFAYELLASVSGWFTEDFDTTDLQDTRTLLEELQA